MAATTIVGQQTASRTKKPADTSQTIGTFTIIDQQSASRTKKTRRQDMTDEEAFFAVCKEGDLEDLRVFLEDGVNYNIIDRSGYTPLLHAVNGGFLECARELLEAGTFPFPYFSLLHTNLRCQTQLKSNPYSNNLQ